MQPETIWELEQADMGAPVWRSTKFPLTDDKYRYMIEFSLNKMLLNDCCKFTRVPDVLTVSIVHAADSLELLNKKLTGSLNGLVYAH